MNGSWNMERGRETFLSLQSIFCFFCSNDPKDQNFKKKMKKAPGDIIILHMCTKNYDHMMYHS